MRNHLRENISLDSADYSILFREMFCVAARRLSDSICLPFERMGILYDRILETGTDRASSPSSPRFGRGQFLFLVKHASRAETEHLLASGYRFGEPSNVLGTVARAMQVERSYIEQELSLMGEYHGPQIGFKAGVHVGFCDMRPNLTRGFNIIVRKHQSHAIPANELALTSLDTEQKAHLLDFAGQTVGSVVTALSQQSERDMTYNPKIRILRSVLSLTVYLTTRTRLHRALIGLAAEVNDVAFMEATLLPETFQLAANYTQVGNHGPESTGQASLIIFRNVSPVHSSQPLSTSHLVSSPLSLFLAQQSVLPNVRSTFAKEARDEFLRLLDGTVDPNAPELPGLGPWVFGHFMEGKMKTGMGNDVSIEGGTELVQQRRLLPSGSNGSSTRISGIVVHKTVAVTVRDKDSDGGSTTSGLSKGAGIGTPLMMADAVWANILFKGILIGF
jgi:hypothetical protein